ncbi:hypothetical protein HWI79_250 [Cryptosporidium felis]|nr:hypothetical protein HWI79_250 [Cryptosporidium felis]
MDSASAGVLPIIDAFANNAANKLKEVEVVRVYVAQGVGVVEFALGALSSEECVVRVEHLSSQDVVPLPGDTSGIQPLLVVKSYVELLLQLIWALGADLLEAVHEDALLQAILEVAPFVFEVHNHRGQPQEGDEAPIRRKDQLRERLDQSVQGLLMLVAESDYLVVLVYAFLRQILEAEAGASGGPALLAIGVRCGFACSVQVQDLVVEALREGPNQRGRRGLQVLVHGLELQEVGGLVQKLGGGVGVEGGDRGKTEKRDHVDLLDREAGLQDRNQEQNGDVCGGDAAWERRRSGGGGRGISGGVGRPVLAPRSWTGAFAQELLQSAPFAQSLVQTGPQRPYIGFSIGGEEELWVYLEPVAPAFLGVEGVPNDPVFRPELSALQAVVEPDAPFPASLGGEAASTPRRLGALRPRGILQGFILAEGAGEELQVSNERMNYGLRVTAAAGAVDLFLSQRDRAGVVDERNGTKQRLQDLPNVPGGEDLPGLLAGRPGQTPPTVLGVGTRLQTRETLLRSIKSFCVCGEGRESGLPSDDLGREPRIREPSFESVQLNERTSLSRALLEAARESSVPIGARVRATPLALPDAPGVPPSAENRGNVLLLLAQVFGGIQDQVLLSGRVLVLHHDVGGHTGPLVHRSKLQLRVLRRKGRIQSRNGVQGLLLMLLPAELEPLLGESSLPLPAQLNAGTQGNRGARSSPLLRPALVRKAGASGKLGVDRGRKGHHPARLFPPTGLVQGEIPVLLPRPRLLGLLVLHLVLEHPVFRLSGRALPPQAEPNLQVVLSNKVPELPAGIPLFQEVRRQDGERGKQRLIRYQIGQVTACTGVSMIANQVSRTIHWLGPKDPSRLNRDGVQLLQVLVKETAVTIAVISAPNNGSLTETIHPRLSSIAWSSPGASSPGQPEGRAPTSRALPPSLPSLPLLSSSSSPSKLPPPPSGATTLLEAAPILELLRDLLTERRVELVAESSSPKPAILLLMMGTILTKLELAEAKFLEEPEIGGKPMLEDDPAPNYGGDVLQASGGNTRGGDARGRSAGGSVAATADHMAVLGSQQGENVLNGKRRPASGASDEPKFTRGYMEFSKAGPSPLMFTPPGDSLEPRLPPRDEIRGMDAVILRPPSKLMFPFWFPIIERICIAPAGGGRAPSGVRQNGCGGKQASNPNIGVGGGVNVESDRGYSPVSVVRDERKQVVEVITHVQDVSAPHSAASRSGVQTALFIPVSGGG